MGDARGHFEGDTLIVETTNFTEKIGVGLSGGGTPNSFAMRLTERFTRVSKDTIRYEATVNDPDTWTAPWTVAFPLTRMPDYGMFEYACHEGNHGLLNALSGSRAERRRCGRGTSLVLGPLFLVPGPSLVLCPSWVPRPLSVLGPWPFVRP